MATTGGWDLSQRALHEEKGSLRKLIIVPEDWIPSLLFSINITADAKHGIYPDFTGVHRVNVYLLHRFLFCDLES